MVSKRLSRDASLLQGEKGMGSLSKVPSSFAGNVIKNSWRTTWGENCGGAGWIVRGTKKPLKSLQIRPSHL